MDGAAALFGMHIITVPPHLQALFMARSSESPHNLQQWNEDAYCLAFLHVGTWHQNSCPLLAFPLEHSSRRAPPRVSTSAVIAKTPREPLHRY
jgi:hypothetical protein